MNPNRYLRTHAGRLVLTFLLLCLIVYTVYHAVGNTSGSLITTPVRTATDTQLLGGQAWLFRNETLLTHTEPGLVNSLARNGEKVSRNAPLTQVWVGTPADRLEQAQAELDALNRTLEVLEESELPPGSSLSQADGYRDAAAEGLLQIRLALREGSWSLLAGLEDEVLTALNRYAALTGSSEELQAARDEAEQARQSLLSGSCVTLTNHQSSSYYYDHTEVDGYETLFTVQALQSLTAESFEALKSASPVMPEGQFVAGKLCGEYSWYLAVEFPAGAGELFEVGASYRFRFPESDGMELSLSCERLLTGSDGGTVAVFRSDVTPLGFHYLRSQRVEITVGSTNGYYIPQQALRTRDGTPGVYVFEDSTVEFRRIAVLYEGDGYLIAAGTDPDPENDVPYLSLNDLMITSGKNLYEGKVYQ